MSRPELMLLPPQSALFAMASNAWDRRKARRKAGAA